MFVIMIAIHMKISDFYNCSEMMARVRDGTLDPNFVDKAGHTPLGFAAKEGDVRVINLLLKSNADPSKVNEKELCLLFRALINKQECHTVSIALSYLSDEKINNIQNVSSPGQTPLIYAAICLSFSDDTVSLDTFNHILNRSNNINHEDKQGMTALTTLLLGYEMVDSYSLPDAIAIKVAQSLIDKGANPYHINQYGKNMEYVLGPIKLLDVLRRYKDITSHATHLKNVLQKEFKNRDYEPETTCKIKI